MLFPEKPISRIFKEQGEKTFRDMETALLTDLCRDERQYVIAIGGGLITRG